MSNHLVFFDGDCGLCHKLVLHLIGIDPQRRLFFAPLEGETAQEILIGPNAHYARDETLVLVENFRTDKRQFWVYSQAIFRIYWLLGSRWIGWLCFLPSFLSDAVYRSAAKHRHRLHFGWERKEFQTDRFLP